MKNLIILTTLLFFVVPEAFSQETQSDQEATNVYYSANYISVKNPDGTNSTINRYGSLAHSDGTSATINFNKRTSSVIAVDGTNWVILQNGLSSTVTSPDGVKFFINHMRNRSACTSVYGRHTITHNFGATCHNQKLIDILLHTNWLAQKKYEAEEAQEEATEKEVSEVN